jgi:sulfatase maturation enzyme AslB (radical SAM superfamily)
VYVSLTTNGEIMNEKKTQRLIDAGVHMVGIVIDATKWPHQGRSYAYYVEDFIQRDT